MGRSRGGLTTKIHALVDANGLPVVLKLTEGQAHDGRGAADMLDDIGTDQNLLANRAMTITRYAPRCRPEALERTLSRCRTGSTHSPSARSCIATGTSSSGSSTS